MAIRIVILNVLLLCQIFNIMSKLNYFIQRAIVIFAFVMGSISMLNAQWVSPGNGTTYTMSELVNVTGGVVTFEAPNYYIHGDLTFSTNDTWKIDNGFTKVFVEDALITIYGSMICENTNRVSIMGDPSFRMRFENATGCLVKKMYFSDGAGVQLIESDVTFDDVKFVYFTTEYCHSAIDILNCNPLIENCYFLLNEGAAIGSPVNGQSSPRIMNCEFDSNVNGANMPQINLGPGDRDTIYIVANLIDGTYANFHTGGISIADLMGTGDTKILLKDNTIKNNRYGYNQQGYRLSSVITGNIIEDNYHEDNPMNGGSGISIYGMDSNNKAVIRENIITGNLWGITAINAFEIDLGTDNSWGNNRIYGNGNNGEVYDLYNNSTYDIKAVGNDWGTANEQEVEKHIFHQYDDPSLGWVNFIPFIGYDAVNELEAAQFEVSPNPVSNGSFSLILDKATPSEVEIYNLFGQKVFSQHIENEVNTIIINPLESGVYFVKVKTANNTMSQKIIIE